LKVAYEEKGNAAFEFWLHHLGFRMTGTLQPHMQMKQDFEFGKDDWFGWRRM
jgi:hypothetical protein